MTGRAIHGERTNSRRMNVWRDPLSRIAEKVIKRTAECRNPIAVVVTPGGEVVIAESRRVESMPAAQEPRRWVGVYGSKGSGENQICDDLEAWALENSVKPVPEEG